MDLIPCALASERVGHDLIVAHAAAEGTETALEALLFVVAALGGSTLENGGNYLVVAVKAGDLLRNISVMLDVLTEGGNANRVAIHGEIKLFKNPHHEVLLNIRSEQGVNALRLKLKLDGLIFAAHNVYCAV